MTSGCLLDFFCCQSNLTFHSPPALYASKHMRTCSSLFLATARGGRSSSENQSKLVVLMFFLEASAGDVAEGEDLADTICVVGSVVPFPVVQRR